MLCAVGFLCAVLGVRIQCGLCGYVGEFGVARTFAWLALRRVGLALWPWRCPRCEAVVQQVPDVEFSAEDR